MELALTAEQRDLQQMLRRFLEEHSSETAVRASMESETGLDPTVWKRISEDLGLPAIMVPEEHGGLGGSLIDVTVVAEEMGRALLSGPFFASAVLAATTLCEFRSDTEAAKILEGLSNGELTAALAVVERAGGWAASQIATTARPDAEQWRLDGEKLFVVDGATADLVLVGAQLPEGLSLFAVDTAAQGLSREPMDTSDRTRRQAHLTMEGVPGRLVGAPGELETVLDRVVDRAGIALAAEQIGGARQCLETAVEHAKNRIQFGRPIGSFQAVQHRLSEMLLEVELGAAGVRYAAASMDEAAPDAYVSAALVQAHAAETYVRVATDAIQVLGGIGFTWEHPAHLYLRRALSTESFFGGAVAQRERLAERIGLGQTSD